jgi:hypothetical protein
VLNAADDSARFSHDFDLFHDAVDDLVAASERDVGVLERAGLEVEKINRHGSWDKPVSFRKAIVRGAEGAVELDWAHDSAFHFYPIVPDPLLGWRLHVFDMATNKALSLSARSETRDYVDIVELGRRYSLEAIMWAACAFTIRRCGDVFRRLCRRRIRRRVCADGVRTSGGVTRASKARLLPSDHRRPPGQYWKLTPAFAQTTLGCSIERRAAMATE